MDKCIKCGNVLHILNAGVRVKGDNSNETPTQVFTVHRLVCVNPKCSRYYDGTNPSVIVEEETEIEQIK